MSESSRHRASISMFRQFKFLYTVTLEMPWSDDCFVRAHCPSKLPVVLSQEELMQFFDYVPSLKYRAALMICYGAGLRISEVVALKITDIDSQRMLIRIDQGKGKKDRYSMLAPRLLEVLRRYWRAIRPQQWLFPSWRPTRHLSTGYDGIDAAGPRGRGSRVLDQCRTADYVSRYRSGLAGGRRAGADRAP